jgi:hypothetical protein
MFWYYVAPFAEAKWSILFEGQPHRYTYDSADEALKVACRAAEVTRNHEHMATGVRVKMGDSWRDAVTFSN